MDNIDKDHRFKLIRLLRDFSIQWSQACKYKRYEDYTLAELDDWIENYIDYRILGKKDEDDLVK